MPYVMAALPNRWSPRRKFLNSVPCTTPQSLAHVHCSSANIGQGKTSTQRKVNFAPGKIPERAPKNVYTVHQPRRRPNIVQSVVGLSDVGAVTNPTNETR